jgi:hypothetical protein
MLQGRLNMGSETRVASPARNAPARAEATAPARLRALQQAAGNHAVARMLRANKRMLQRAGVTARQGQIPDAWLTELRNIVTAAENSTGSTFQFTLPGRFTSAQGPTNTQQTFALGGTYYQLGAIPGGQTVSLIGPSSAFGSQKFATSVKSSEWLGNRQSAMHGEMALVEAKGVENIDWAYATQDNCLFCHGYLEMHGIQHQGLRPDPWPQMWRHPDGLFKLQAGNAAVGRVVEIEFRGQRRLYQISA